ncbi:unnamed protein product, partial [Ectocarpus sp. 4 AP-2014]
PQPRRLPSQQHSKLAVVLLHMHTIQHPTISPRKTVRNISACVPPSPPAHATSQRGPAETPHIQGKNTCRRLVCTPATIGSKQNCTRTAPKETFEFELQRTARTVRDHIDSSPLDWWWHRSSVERSSVLHTSTNMTMEQN